MGHGSEHEEVHMNYLVRVKNCAITHRVAMAAMFLCLIASGVTAQDPPRATPEVRSILDSVNEALYAKTPRYDEAVALAEKALVRARATGDQRGEVDALFAKGAVQAIRGRSEEALSLYQDALSLAEGRKDGYGQAIVLFWTGLLHESKNRWEAAGTAFDRALQVVDDT